MHSLETLTWIALTCLPTNLLTWPAAFSPARVLFTYISLIIPFPERRERKHRCLLPSLPLLTHRLVCFCNQITSWEYAIFPQLSHARREHLELKCY
ncbi:hypothetical protein E2C01_031289 [Portunus trituberculatus]|uniref:Uncharacterized protein n=1 Tax=Portunus trituberculatus TaxID=210409 RepID=A0A5B7EXQ5_PORTR|nr:hypothetical protein [Portunus trituberculatus]